MIYQLALLFFLNPNHVTIPSDSTPGRLVGRTQLRGQFFSFDKNQETRFIFADASNNSRLLLTYGAPEMACFIANHDKEDLRLSYSTFERTDSSGATNRYYVADRIVSLKSGDDTISWLEKDVADSAGHHLKLAKLRKEMLGKN